MIKFTASTISDIPQIAEWIAADPYHKHQGQPEWWLTGSGLLTFCLQDDKGPLTFVRLDEEGEHVRIHTQFAPKEIVSQRRLLLGMIDCLTELVKIYRTQSRAGLIFNSVSPTLVAFMEKCFDFKSVGGDDYRLDFEVQK
jgi:hypothetical protein